MDDEGFTLNTFDWPQGERVISEETSEEMREILESVVAEGTGNKAQVPGYRIGRENGHKPETPQRKRENISPALWHSLRPMIRR